MDWLAVREATQWTPVDHAYRQIANKVNPRVDNYIEIVKEDFDQDNCIERVVGYLAPQVSGNYRFAGACDDHMGFYLSTDESYVNTANEPVTWEQGWNSSISTFGNGRIYDWKNADGNEVTHEMGQVYLEAGKRYFFTAVLAEIGGGDYLTIDWARGRRKLPSQWLSAASDRRVFGSLCESGYGNYRYSAAAEGYDGDSGRNGRDLCGSRDRE